MEHITIPAHVDRLDDVLGFVENAVRDAEISPKQQNNIMIAVEEIFVNIASYAYPSGDGDVTICAEGGPDSVIVEFQDSGIPYDPLSKSDPDVSLSAEDREIGGLGIYMVKKLMDSVKYRHEDGRNIMMIEKYTG